MEQILLAYGLPKEVITAIMMLYENMKIKVRSPDGDKLLWHCCSCSARVYISPISVHNLLRLCTSNLDWSNEKKNDFTLKKKRKKQTIPRRDYYGRRLTRWHSDLVYLSEFLTYPFYKWTRVSDIGVWGGGVTRVYSSDQIFAAEFSCSSKALIFLFSPLFNCVYFQHSQALAIFFFSKSSDAFLISYFYSFRCFSFPFFFIHYCN